MSTTDSPISAVPSGFLPPADFPLYGAQPWPGFRELDDTVHIAWGRRRFGPAVGFWLGHQTLDRAGGVRVGTFHRQRFDRSVELGQLPGGGRGRLRHLGVVPDVPGDVLAAVARQGTTAVADLTLPDPEEMAGVPEADRVFRLTSAHLAAAAEDVGGWESTGWAVDGRPLPARVLRFGGAWTGFVVLPTAYVVAVGVGIEPQTLTLQSMESTDAYGVDLAAPLLLAWRLQRNVTRREVRETVLRRPNRSAFHPDQLALVDTDSE